MAVAMAVLVLGMAFILGILYRYFGNQIELELKKEASYLSKGVELEGENYLKSIKNADSRVTYIDEDGTVIYDSEADASLMENHAHREEVQEAAAHGNGSSIRMSKTLSEQTIYYAVRLDDGKILRISSTQFSIFALLYNLLLPMFWIIVLMVILSGVIASKVSKKVVDPINNLDLEHPEENQVYEEVGPLLSRIYKQNRQIREQIELAGRKQEEFSIITENMQEGLLVIDRYTIILSGNSSVWKLFHTDEQKKGCSVYSLDRNEDFRKVIEKVLGGRHNEAVLKINEKDVQIIANPVVREQEVQGAVILLLNVTEKVERESLRREFSANVSHELKTPLTSISGFAELIQAGYVREEDVKQFAGKIYKEAQNMIRLVEDIIRVSQLDEGEIPYEREDVDLQKLSREIFDTLQESAKMQNVHLYVEGSTVIVYTVKSILKEALYNLCDNAIKYNRPNGTVCVQLGSNEQEVQICVEDTGCGIPKEDQSRVFERFYRVDKSHSKEIGGTGLGLSIVKHGVAFLGGTLELQSEPGIGTKVTMVFPKNNM